MFSKGILGEWLSIKATTTIIIIDDSTAGETPWHYHQYHLEQHHAPFTALSSYGNSHQPSIATSCLTPYLQQRCFTSLAIHWYLQLPICQWALYNRSYSCGQDLHHVQQHHLSRQRCKLESDVQQDCSGSWVAYSSNEWLLGWMASPRRREDTWILCIESIST